MKERERERERGKGSTERRRMVARKCGSAMRERWKRAVGCRELLVSEGRKDMAPKETKKERERCGETSRERVGDRMTGRGRGRG